MTEDTERAATQSDEQASGDAQKPDQGDDKAKELVAKAGETLRSGAKLTGRGIRTVWSDPLLFVKRLDAAIDWIRRTFPSELFDLIVRWFSQIGHAGLMVAAVAGLVFYVIQAIKMGSLFSLLYGCGFVVLLVIVQYASQKFLGAVDTLTKSSPTSLTSEAFLRCVALISEVAGILILVRCTLAAISMSALTPFLYGIGIFVVCDALAFVAIHPGLVSVSISEDASSGQEAIGIVSFFVKTFVRLVPILFGTGVLIGAVLLIISIFNSSTANTSVAFWTGRELGLIGIPGRFAMGMGMPVPAAIVIQWSLLPFMSYMVFALYCLLVELLQSILRLPKGETK